MRRRDREVAGRGDLLAIMGKADVCRLAFASGGTPYIVTLNFGFEWEGDFPVLYFHCARKGRKLDMMRANPRVCFELDVDHELSSGLSPCDWSMKFGSVVGYGVLSELADEAARTAGLDRVMRHYGWTGPSDYEAGALRATAVLALRVDELSGKRKA